MTHVRSSIILATAVAIVLFFGAGIGSWSDSKATSSGRVVNPTAMESKVDGSISLNQATSTTASTTVKATDTLASSTNIASGTSGSDASGSTTSSTVVVASAPVAPNVSMSASPVSVLLGHPSTLSWNSSGAVSCLASDATSGAGIWSGPKGLNGTQSVSPTTSGPKVYQMTCANAAGSNSSSVTVIAHNGTCPGGETNWPTCTTIADMCVNEAINPPLCTTGKCGNGASDWPVCTPSLGFSIGPDRDIRISFLSGRAAGSEVISVPVLRTGGFMGPVAVSASVSPALPAGVAPTYTFGGDYASNFLVGTTSTSFTFGTSLSQKIDDACGSLPDGSCRYYYVTVTAVDPYGAVPSDSVRFRISQTTLDPIYDE